MDKIKIKKVTRQQMELVALEWMPVIRLYAETIERNHTGDFKIMASCLKQLIEEVAVSFNRKLANPSIKRFNISFTPGCAAAFYFFLMKLPIDDSRLWEKLQRQFFTETIDRVLNLS
jgi:hypothetical protein